MDLGLNGRTALVCGASRGIGFAIAQSLIQEGVRVAICARKASSLKEAQLTLQSISNTSVLAFQADLGNKSDVEQLVSTALDELGSIHILINNVGSPAPGNLMDLGDEQWYEGFESSFMSIVRLTKLVLPSMRHQKWGRIISIASNTAKEPRSGILLSSAFRAAVCAFNKGIAGQLATENVLVHSVCPGPIATSRVLTLTEEIAHEKNITLEQAKASLIGNLPMGRMGTPEEVASLVTYLVSENSRFMAGNTIQIDGGQLLSW